MPPRIHQPSPGASGRTSQPEGQAPLPVRPAPVLPARGATPLPLSPAQVLHLQRTVGNAAVGRLLRGGQHPGAGSVQRVRWTKGEEIAIDWGKLLPEEAAYLLRVIGTGEMTASGMEMLRLRQLASTATPTPTGGGIWSELTKEDWESDDESYDGNQMSEEQMELVESLLPGIKAQVEKREARLPGKQVMGNMLEQHVSTFSGDMGFLEVNANQFAMNIPGIDHIQDHPRFPFLQDKMHLSSHTAKPETYREHYRKRGTMAVKLLERMATGTATSVDNMFQSVLKNVSWQNKEVIQELVKGVARFRKSYEEALDSETSNSLPRIEDEEDLVKLVSNAIAFPVPADIWEALYQASEHVEPGPNRISASEMSAYRRLDMTTQDFQQVFGQFSEFATKPGEKTRINPEEDDYDPTKK